MSLNYASRSLIALNEHGALYHTGKIPKAIRLLEKFGLVKFSVTISKDNTGKEFINDKQTLSELQIKMKTLKKFRDNQYPDNLFKMTTNELLKIMTQDEINAILNLATTIMSELDYLSVKNLRDNLFLYKGTKIRLLLRLSEYGKTLIMNCDNDLQNIEYALSVMKKLY